MIACETAFTRGETMAREYLCGGIEARGSLSTALAVMRDRQRFGESESGFVTVLVRKAILGAKPIDLDDATPLELSPDESVDFWLGMLAAMDDLETAKQPPCAQAVISRVERGFLYGEATPEFAGYMTVLISAATACAAH
jgi:hypothetical protein